MCRTDHLAGSLCPRCSATLTSDSEPVIDWSGAKLEPEGPAAALALRSGGAIPLLGAAPVSIGRDAGSQIWIGSTGVSGRHAELRRDDGRWEIRDLGSNNGTTVDAVELEPERWRRLTHGEVIGFGDDLEAFFGEVEDADIEALIDEDSPRTNRDVTSVIDPDAADLTLALSLEGFRDGGGRALILDGRREWKRVRLVPAEFELLALLLRRRKGERSLGRASEGFVREAELAEKLGRDPADIAALIDGLRSRFAAAELANPLESRARRGLRVRHPLARVY